MRERLTFGPFVLIPDERLLLRDGVPVTLGARAFDVLSALVAASDEVVGKTDLMARVWPDVTVEEGSLRFHVAGLRKALGEGHGGGRYIATLTGRGYRFVAPVARSVERSDRGGDDLAGVVQAVLPSRPARVLGRGADMAGIAARLTTERLVTVVGMGGVGKTTVAVTLGHDLVETFADAVFSVDLGLVTEPDLVATTAASMFGLAFEPGNPVPALTEFLGRRRSCLILDSCEHIVEAAAALAARLFETVPNLHILATSREPLQVRGEHVFRLAPLALPPDDADLTGARLLDFPATRLFLERVAATGAGAFDEAEAALVADICLRLDGVPLAIELAAGRVAGLGLRTVAALLGERLTLSWTGPRTAPARQRTLQATLDWSYRLLSESERRVLRRLAVLVGHFSLEAALAVVKSPGLDAPLLIEAVEGLVAKSMLSLRPTGNATRYRLLDATRTYLLQHRGTDVDTDQERRALAARHAAHYLSWLEETGSEWPSLSSVPQRSCHLAGLANVREALDWCFGPGGDVEFGTRLTVAAAPVLLSMSLLIECHRATARAIQALDGPARGGREEMLLQAALGVALMFTRGGQAAALAALTRSRTIATARGDARDEIQVLGPLHMFHLRAGAFRAALACAERCSHLAGGLEDPASSTLAQSLMGISLHLGGKHDRACTVLESVVRDVGSGGGIATSSIGFDGRLLAGAILARTHWLRGCPDQAIERARLSIEDAEALGHPLTLAIVLVWTISVFLWVGDLDRAERETDRLFARARQHALSPYLAVGRGFRGEIAVRRGAAEAGTRDLRLALSELHAAPYELLTTPLNLALADGFLATSRVAEAEGLIEETIRSVYAHGDACYLPELFRMRARLARILPHASGSAARDEGEAWLVRSLDLSRQGGARAWELRAALDLAARHAERGERDVARELLLPLHRGFKEGRATTDLRKAADLLEMLN